MGNFQDKAFRLNAYISTIGKNKNRWELETLAWQWKVKTTYISIFLGPYRQPWKSHQPCASDALPSPIQHCRPSWTLHGLNTDFNGTLSIYHAHMKTRRVGWPFYYLLPIAQWHSQARGATATSDSGLESDLEFPGQKRWLHAAPKKHGASYPMAGAEYLSSPKTFYADSICVDSSSVNWMGLVLLEWEARMKDGFGNQSGELQMYKKRIPHNWLHSTQSNNEDQITFGIYQGEPCWKLKFADSMDVGRLRAVTQDTHNLYPQARLCQLVVSTTWFRKTRKASVHLTIHWHSATLSAMTRHAGQLIVIDFCRIFFCKHLNMPGKHRLFLQNALFPQITHVC